MNAVELAVRAQAPSRSACAIAGDLWSASHALVELAARVASGAKVATEIDALARGLSQCATELRARGDGDAP